MHHMYMHKYICSKNFSLYKNTEMTGGTNTTMIYIFPKSVFGECHWYIGLNICYLCNGNINVCQRTCYKMDDMLYLSYWWVSPYVILWTYFNFNSWWSFSALVRHIVVLLTFEVYNICQHLYVITFPNILSSRMCVSLYIYFYVCTYICIVIGTYVFVYVCMLVRTYVSIHACNTYVCTHICIYVCM